MLKFSDMPKDKRKKALSALVISIGGGKHDGMMDKENMKEDESSEQMTSADKDGHTHKVIFIDEKGNGATDMSGEPSHAHAIVSNKVQPASVGGYVSNHNLESSKENDGKNNEKEMAANDESESEEESEY